MSDYVDVVKEFPALVAHTSSVLLATLEQLRSSAERHERETETWRRLQRFSVAAVASSNADELTNIARDLRTQVP